MTLYRDVTDYIYACLDASRGPDYCLIQKATGLPMKAIRGYVTGVQDAILCERYGIVPTETKTAGMAKPEMKAMPPETVREAFLEKRRAADKRYRDSHKVERKAARLRREGKL